MQEDVDVAEGADIEKVIECKIRRKIRYLKNFYLIEMENMKRTERIYG